MKEQQSLTHEGGSIIALPSQPEDRPKQQKWQPFKIITFSMSLLALTISIVALVISLKGQNPSSNIFIIQDQRKGQRFLSLANQTDVVSTVLPLSNIQKSMNDGGSINFQLMYLGSPYFSSNNIIYDDPVGQYFRAIMVADRSRISLAVVLLEAGFNYQLFVYVRNYGMRNPWRNGQGQISSANVRLTMGARRLESDLSLNTTKPWDLNVTADNYTFEWSQYSSEVFVPEESALYAISAWGDPYFYNGNLFDFCLPTLRMWR